MAISEGTAGGNARPDPANGGYRAHYIRHAQGNIMATYRFNPASLVLNDRPLYGSSRLGNYAQDLQLYNVLNTTSATAIQQLELNYELTDHLGNVSAVVTGHLITNLLGITPCQAQLVSAQGYEGFGSLLPGRNYSTSSYRFGFNGQEKDDEVFGSAGTSYAFEYRMHDTRVGRFLSIDPLAREFAYYSPYIFAGSSPIAFIDLDGLERVSAITFNGDVNYRAGHLRLMNGDEISRKVLTTNPAGQMVEAFREASTADPNGIGFVAIWGHGTRDDQWGTASNSSNMVIDDLDQLEQAVANGDIHLPPTPPSTSVTAMLEPWMMKGTALGSGWQISQGLE